MTAQHTPGPWDVYQNTICTADGNANEIAKLTRYGVWAGAGAPYGPRNPIGDANAHLIAAAPDLLAALRMLVQDCNDYRMSGPEWGNLRASLSHARAAIAKAEGR